MGNAGPHVAPSPSELVERRMLMALRSNDWSAIEQELLGVEMVTPRPDDHAAPPPPLPPARELDRTWRESMRSFPLEASRGWPVNLFQIRGGFSLLHQAVCCCSPSVVRALLQVGADANQPSEGTMSTHDSAETAADVRLYQNAADPTRIARRWTLDYTDRLRGNLNSQLKYRDTHFSPLMCAIIFAKDEVVTEICELLLWSGADVNAVTLDSGWTPLMFAAQRSYAPLLQLLLSYGANRRALSEHGSASDIARVFGASGANAADKASAVFQAQWQLRSATRLEIERALGGQHNMAQDCVEICLQYLATATTRAEAEAERPTPAAASSSSSSSASSSSASAL